MANRTNANDDKRTSRAREESTQVGKATIFGVVLGAVAVGAAWLVSSLLDDSASKMSSPQQTQSSSRQSSFDATRNHPAESGEENITCVICMTNKANCLIQPCGHMKMCCLCSDKVQVCPLCRVDIVEKIGPVFL